MNYSHIQDISKTLGGKKVLDHIDLQVEKDEFLTLLGSNGCEKTTLLRILGGFEGADPGKVLFEGRDISQ